MLRKALLIFIFLQCTHLLMGQLHPLVDQYHLNGLAINPAYAGSQEALNISIHSRNQWIGFEGAPKTNTLSLHTPMRNKKVNLGIILLSDRLGSKSETGVLLNYAYRIQMGKGHLSFGLAAGFSHIARDRSTVVSSDPGDLLLIGPLQKANLPEFSLGSYYSNDRFFAGISMPLFLTHYTNEESGNYQPGFNFASANYLFTSGYLFDLNNDIELLPSCMLRINPANNVQADININMIIKKLFWIGSSIRTNGNLSALLQWQINYQLRLGYSYGYELSQLSTYQNGTHEIVLQYNFRYIIEVVNPRYF